MKNIFVWLLKKSRVRKSIHDIVLSCKDLSMWPTQTLKDTNTVELWLWILSSLQIITWSWKHCKCNQTFVSASVVCGYYKDFPKRNWESKKELKTFLPRCNAYQLMIKSGIRKRVKSKNLFVDKIDWQQKNWHNRCKNGKKCKNQRITKGNKRKENILEKNYTKLKIAILYDHLSLERQEWN